MANSIEAVFFDVGSTLLYPHPDVADMFMQVAAERGHVVAKEDVLAHMPQVDEFYESEYLRDGDFWCSHERATAIWIDMYRLLSQLVGLESDSEGLSRDLHSRYQYAQAWALYSDVKPCLMMLKQKGLHLGVISNWDAGLEELLRRIGLLPYFDDVVASAAVGYRKPDHVVFELALERMGVQASTALHVGDLPVADGDGASSVGITPLIIDRSGRFADDAAMPYIRMASLLEVAQHV